MCFLNRALIITILAIILVDWMPGWEIQEYRIMRLIAALLGIANAMVRPLLLLLSIQPRVLPIALATLLINSLGFYLASDIYFGVRVPSVASGAFAFLLIWATSTFLNRYVYIQRDRL